MIHEDYYSFYPAKDVPRRFFVGYEEQIQAGAALSHIVASERQPFSVLLFGMPGTGKSSLPFALAEHMKERYGFNFSIAHVQCGGLADIQDASKALDNVNRLVVLSEKYGPTYLVFEEIDAFSSIMSAPHISASFTRYTRGLLRNLPRGTLFIGTANFPRNVDFSIMRYVHSLMYMEPPSREVVAKTIENLLDRGDSKEVTDHLWKKLETVGFVPFGSDIVQACMTVRESFAGKYRQYTSEHFAELLSATMPGISKESVDEYEERNRGLIQRAKAQQEYWAGEISRKLK